MWAIMAMAAMVVVWKFKIAMREILRSRKSNLEKRAKRGWNDRTAIWKQLKEPGAKSLK